MPCRLVAPTVYISLVIGGLNYKAVDPNYNLAMPVVQGHTTTNLIMVVHVGWPHQKLAKPTAAKLPHKWDQLSFNRVNILKKHIIFLTSSTHTSRGLVDQQFGTFPYLES